MKKIYVVFGEYGEYSNHEIWPIRGFETEAEAESFAQELEAGNKTCPPEPNWNQYPGSVKYADCDPAWLAVCEAWDKWAHPITGCHEKQVSYTMENIDFGPLSPLSLKDET